jgi:hypothetical protein
MVKARANGQQWLSPAGRSVWAVSVSGLLLFLLMIGGAETLFPAAHALPYTPAQSESEPEDTDEDETATPVVPSVGIPRARKTMGGLLPIPSNSSLLLQNAGTLPHSRQLISALSVGVFAKGNGAGISMRC